MFSPELLNALCPMHLWLDDRGRVLQLGPTLEKICATGACVGDHFSDLFEVYRPRRVASMEQLLATRGRKLHLRLRGATRLGLKGHLIELPMGEALINLSFGIGVVDAVRDFDLTATDFAPTDLAVEMLYLVEAKSAAMDSSRRLNTRLQGDKLAAEERAFTDTLTGLGNRRALDQRLSRLIEEREEFALLHLDLDFFKQVNDSLGHAAGDLVLQSVSHVMEQSTRKGDMVARVGGDEFVIISPRLVSADRLSDLASGLIEKIERPVRYQNQTCQVSASIGITVSGGTPATFEEIMEQADTALYAAKKAGRAQFRFFAKPADVATGEKTTNTAAE